MRKKCIPKNKFKENIRNLDYISPWFIPSEQLNSENHSGIASARKELIDSFIYLKKQNARKQQSGYLFQKSQQNNRNLDNHKHYSTTQSFYKHQQRKARTEQSLSIEDKPQRCLKLIRKDSGRLRKMCLTSNNDNIFANRSKKNREGTQNAIKHYLDLGSNIFINAHSQPKAYVFQGKKLSKNKQTLKKQLKLPKKKQIAPHCLHTKISNDELITLLKQGIRKNSRTELSPTPQLKSTHKSSKNGRRILTNSFM